MAEFFVLNLELAETWEHLAFLQQKTLFFLRVKGFNVFMMVWKFLIFNIINTCVNRGRMGYV